MHLIDLLLVSLFWIVFGYCWYCVGQLRGMRWSTQLWAPSSSYEKIYGRFSSSWTYRLVYGLPKPKRTKELTDAGSREA